MIFCIYWDYRGFCHLFFLMWYITTIDLCILNHPGDPGMTPIWSGAWYFLCVIGLSLLIFYWDILHLYSSKILAYNTLAHMVKNLPAMWETQVWSLGWEDPLEKGMATHYSCLENFMDRRAWWATYSPWSHKEWDRTEPLTLSLSFLFSKYLILLQK